jgi:two-component system sensor histidine kinase KdpD
VDEQLLTQMQAGAIPGPWAAGERILVCISEDPRCAGLVRYAKRLADRLHGPWTALYVEGRRSLQLSEEDRDRIADTLRLAESLGGEAITTPSADRRIADDVVGYAQAQNVTQIIIGKSTRSRWFENPARLCGARPCASVRQYQRARHCRRCRCRRAYP